MEFIARLRSGERMTDLCVEYGISRNTGHKLSNRFDELGVEGLFDRSRAPKHIPHKTPSEVVELVLKERRRHPNWGPRKLKDILERRLGRPFPAASTLGQILQEHGLAERRRYRRRQYARPTLLRPAPAPNDVWCVDYKGQFRLGDQSYCYPLTVTDQYSRYLLGCEAMAAIDENQARECLAGIFRDYGLPRAMRSDNGAPFASTGLAGLSKLSVFWMRLGIAPERIRPAHPEQNGQHERMHRTLKRETTRPARANLLLQQEAFDAFVEEFNTVRPHEALKMKRPADLYRKSPRPYPERLPELTYPTHDDVAEVHRNGVLRVSSTRRPYVSAALAGQPVGIREENDGRLLVSFMELDLGYVERNNTFTPFDPPK
jgi:transposase InsO family protein